MSPRADDFEDDGASFSERRHRQIMELQAEALRRANERISGRVRRKIGAAHLYNRYAFGVMGMGALIVFALFLALVGLAVTGR